MRPLYAETVMSPITFHVIAAHADRRDARHMPAYALAHLKVVAPHPDVLEYMERIQRTLDPFSGRFIVHGGVIEVLEGSWPGALVIIEFPTLAHARNWYDSSEYRAILPLRTRHIGSDTILVDGVDANHDSADFAARLRGAGWLEAPSP